MALYPALSTRSVLGSLIVLGIILFARSNKRKEKLPPGPGGLPILGNLLQIPKDRAWLTFSEWRKTYGDIIYLNIAGQNTVVLGNYKVSSDLLDRRAGIYSDRARNIVAGELLTGGLVLAFAQHNDVWKRMRRGSHESVAKNYFGFQETESTLLVDQFLKDPNDWDKHLRRASTSLVLSVIYGLPPLLDSKNPDILRVNRFTERALHAAAPGAFLKLFSNVKDRVDGGDETSSVASTLIHDQEKLNLTSHESAWVAATLYAAGAETVPRFHFLSSISIHYMISDFRPNGLVHYGHDTVSRGKNKAQEELDTLLPYIRALVNEIMRWRGVAPFSVPHRLTQDDYYEGHFLPKDTICIVNGFNDPDVYGPDAEDFVPERHLNASGRLKPAFPDTKDERHHTYGFGRRICVGRHVSKNSMFIEIACLLWSFNIGPGKNKDDNIVLPDPTDSIDEGLVVRPAAFPCSITPRNAEVESVISQTKELHGYE
ncbi:cytochrome P450 [Mycena olivaceomarginata]|nr:cytochrome P450 [Mycena olivaceomarginata]